MKEAQYYQIEPLQYALQYLPIAKFKDCGGRIDSKNAEPNDILKHLSQNGKGVAIQTASSADQVLQGSMEDVLGQVVKNDSSFEWHCKDNPALNKPHAPFFLIRATLR